MPAVTLRDLRADVAAKLSQLETATAMLERDARKSGAALAERGLGPPTEQIRLAWGVLLTRAIRGLQLSARAARASARWLVRTARSPHIATAFRIAHRCVVEGAFSVMVAGALLLALTIATIVLAPPV